MSYFPVFPSTFQSSCLFDLSRACLTSCSANCHYFPSSARYQDAIEFYAPGLARVRDFRFLRAAQVRSSVGGPCNTPTLCNGLHCQPENGA